MSDDIVIPVGGGGSFEGLEALAAGTDREAILKAAGRGDYLLVLQKPPIGARTWRDHAIPSRWPEKVDRRIHPHIKPIGLISRLIAANSEAGDLVIDPAAGSFVVMRAAQQLDRHFVGGDVLGES